MKRVDPEWAAKTHREATVFLTYFNPANRFLPGGGLSWEVFFDPACPAQGSYRRLREGGVRAVVASLGLLARDLTGKAAVGRMFQVLSAFRRDLERHRDLAELARSGADIRRIARAGRLAVLLHLIGPQMDGDLSGLCGYYELGVRTIHGPFDTTHPEAGTEGGGGRLTDFGRAVIAEMNRLGMAVDVSHASDEAFWEILELSDRPPYASHSNCRALCEVSRNLTDDQIKALGQAGGLIGVHFASGFIDRAFTDAFRATGFHQKLREWEADLKQKYPDPYEYLVHRFDFAGWEASPLHALELSVAAPPLAKLVDHIDRLVELAGLDHVAVGTDYDLGSIPREVETADRLPNLTAALLERGYTGREIKKLWGGNALRYFGEVIG